MQLQSNMMKAKAKAKARAESMTKAERFYFSSISSPYTQNVYRIYLQKYLEFYGMKSSNELLSKDHKTVEDQIIECLNLLLV